MTLNFTHLVTFSIGIDRPIETYLNRPFVNKKTVLSTLVKLGSWVTQIDSDPCY